MGVVIHIPVLTCNYASSCISTFQNQSTRCSGKVGSTACTGSCKLNNNYDWYFRQKIDELCYKHTVVIQKRSVRITDAIKKYQKVVHKKNIIIPNKKKPLRVNRTVVIKQRGSASG